MKWVDVDFMIKLAGWDKSDKYQFMATKAILRGEQQIAMFDADYSEALAYIDKQCQQEVLLQNTAARNNEGIVCEKTGQEDKAIALYEDNIADGYPATHAFERLMKIYRRRKEYDNEIRVIRRAINIFSEENKRRAEAASNEEPAKSSQIYASLESCEKVMGVHGWWIFNPYDINAYKIRLSKAQKLRSNEQQIKRNNQI